MGVKGSFLVLVVLVVTVAAPASALTDVQPYLVALDGHYVVKPLWSVGDTAPETSDPSLRYQMIGIPDGLGFKRNADGSRTLYMNHEMRFDVATEIVMGSPLNRGAVISKVELDASGDVISAERAYDTVFDENVLVGPAAQTDNETPAFGRFCSAFLAGPAYGFDRPIFLTNEETDAPMAFDPRGGSTVAIFDNEAHSLPNLGHFAKENSLVMKDTGRRTVILLLEDGPAGPDSQVYLYVGKKVRRSGVTPLARNGLDNGKLYVLASITEGKNDEASFTSGAIDAVWREIPGAENLTDVDLEAASDGLGGFGFVRVEDGAFDLAHPNEAFFTSTGGTPEAGNGLGRLYKLRLNPIDPLRPARLTVLVNADSRHAEGAAVPLGPDNIGISSKYLMVQEGGTGKTKPILAEQGRDNSIWRYPLIVGRQRTRVDVASVTRIAEVETPARDGIEVPPGTWESSGMISARGWFGPDSWVLTVQTFPPTTEPAPNTFRDGQLLVIYPTAP